MEKEQMDAPTLSGDKNDANSFGKFKNAEELLKAYNSLESEFTKRSQKLKQFENNSEAQKPNEISTPNEPTDWEGKVNKLMKEFPIAQTYADDLVNTVSTDEKYVKGEEGLTKALVDVLSQKIVSKQKMAEDKEVVNMVLENSDNKQKIIEDYITSIRNDPLPKILPKAGGAIPCSNVKPISFSEASKLAQKFLENI